MSHEPLPERVTPVATWDDIVLADETLELLRNLAAHARDIPEAGSESGRPRGGEPHHGLVALFTGDRGTGKTLAAEVVANDLDVDLYRVDLSSLVSKWIGETEKNLSPASRDAPRPLDPGDQQAKQPRPGIHPPHPVHRGIRTPRAGGTRANLGLCVPGRSADRRPGCAAAGSTEHQWRTYPLDRATGFFGRSIDGLHCDDGQCVGSRPTRDAQAGSTNQPARVSLTTDPLSRPSRMRTLSSGSRGHLIPR